MAAAVLAGAGSDREENRRAFREWAHDRRLADRFQVVHDAVPVLAAGTPDGWGVALISGTGSLAYGRTADGRTARAGGLEEAFEAGGESPQPYARPMSSSGAAKERVWPVRCVIGSSRSSSPSFQGAWQSPTKQTAFRAEHPEGRANARFGAS